MMNAAGAWRVARDLCCNLFEEEVCDIFGTDDYEEIFSMKPETVEEKIRDYRKEKYIQEGDIVRNREYGNLLYVFKSYGPVMFDGIDMQGYCHREIPSGQYEKTGDSYPRDVVLNLIRKAAGLEDYEEDE